MGTKRFDSVQDLVRHGCLLRVACKECGRKAQFNYMTLMGLTQHKNTSIPAVLQRMRCSRCGSRKVDWWPKNRD